MAGWRGPCRTSPPSHHLPREWGTHGSATTAAGTGEPGIKHPPRPEKGLRAALSAEALRTEAATLCLHMGRPVASRLLGCLCLRAQWNHCGRCAVLPTPALSGSAGLHLPNPGSAVNVASGGQGGGGSGRFHPPVLFGPSKGGRVARRQEVTSYTSGPSHLEGVPSCALFSGTFHRCCVDRA